MTNYTKKETKKYGDTYYYNDKNNFHRLDGPAVEYADGGKFWYVDGKLHKLDGPAVELADGGKSWWVNDELHRLDGSAVEYASGVKAWYVNGKEFAEEEFNKHPLVIEYNLGKIMSEVLDEKA